MTDVTLRRTQLATPASDEKMMHSAADSDADEVFLDLEDSVAPNAKPDARAPLIKAAREEDWSDKVLSFRMNGIDTKWWYDDLITVVGEAGEFIDDIIVPKVKSASDVHGREPARAGRREQRAGGRGHRPRTPDRRRRGDPQRSRYRPRL